MKVINEFKGDYRWLSNFWKVNILHDGKVYPSVEHAYQAAKSLDEDWKITCLNNNISPGKIKRLSKDIEIRSDWNKSRVKLMYTLCLKKFMKEPLKSKLLSTKNILLVEGNYWNDTFWGVDLKTNKGENMLGKILMHIRDNKL